MVSFLWPLGPIVSFVQPPRLMVFIIASPALKSFLWPPRLMGFVRASLAHGIFCAASSAHGVFFEASLVFGFVFEPFRLFGTSFSDTFRFGSACFGTCWFVGFFVFSPSPFFFLSHWLHYNNSVSTGDDCSIRTRPAAIHNASENVHPAAKHWI